MNFSKIAHGIILSAITFFACLILYQIFDYQEKLIGVGEFMFYYFLPTTILIAFVASLRLPETKKFNFALSLFSIAITLYAIEGSVALYTGTQQPSLTKHGQPFDYRVPLEVVMDLENTGLKAVPAIRLATTLRREYDTQINGALPLGGISNALTVFCNELGDYVFYQSDEHGFHNPKGLYQSPLDIAVVGDSFAQGACVTSSENAVALIRKTYPKTLNLGVSGHSALATLATLKEYAQPLRPKVVLWFYYEGNDLQDLPREKKNGILLNYLKPGYQQNLLTIQPQLDQTLNNIVAREYRYYAKELEREKYSVYKFLTLTHLRVKLGLYSARRFEDSNPPLSEADFILFQQILQEAQKTTSSWGGTLYFIYLPAWQRFSNITDENFYRERALQIVTDLNIPVIDIYPLFQAQPDPLALFPFREHGHYTPAGYNLVANAVLQFIEENNQ